MSDQVNTYSLIPYIVVLNNNDFGVHGQHNFVTLSFDLVFWTDALDWYLGAPYMQPSVKINSAE